jgi:hypothetical protein
MSVILQYTHWRAVIWSGVAAEPSEGVNNSNIRKILYLSIFIHFPVQIVNKLKNPCTVLYTAYYFCNMQHDLRTLRQAACQDRSGDTLNIRWNKITHKS